MDERVMSVTVRPYRSGDAGKLGFILDQAFASGETYAVDASMTPQEAVTWWTVPAKTVFMAEDADGRVVGTYYLRANAEGNGAHICNCGYVTDSAARGQGVASAMLAHSLQAARDAGYRGMQYNAVVETNEGAIRLWQKSGFDVIGRVPGAFNHPTAGYVDTLVMFKSLVAQDGR